MPHYNIPELTRVTEALFCAKGMQADKAHAVSHSLITADAMGHGTHGLALVPWYMEAIDSGALTMTGEMTVLNDTGSCITWEGHRLPGAWLISRATDVVLERIQQHGVVTVAIGNSQHTGALAVYLPRLTGRGLMVQLVCSSPAAKGVAPFGGTVPLLSPNPISAGIPTQGDPVLLDISASITTLNSARQLLARGERFPSAWAMDQAGQPSDDPATVISQGGTLLPTGGLDHGHKGYSMALLAEALTQGLSGQGRKDKPVGTTLSVFLQVLDPRAFAGVDAFTAQTQWLVDACHANPPRPGVERVRVPGEQALVRQRAAQAQGVPLSESVVAAFQAVLAQHGLVMPQALA